MKKVIITIVMLFAFIALFCETQTVLSQILWSASWLVVLIVAGKLAYKHCLTNEEKEETV